MLHRCFIDRSLCSSSYTALTHHRSVCVKQYTCQIPMVHISTARKVNRMHHLYEQGCQLRAQKKSLCQTSRTHVPHVYQECKKSDCFKSSIWYRKKKHISLKKTNQQKIQSTHTNVLINKRPWKCRFNSTLSLNEYFHGKSISFMTQQLITQRSVLCAKKLIKYLMPHIHEHTVVIKTSRLLIGQLYCSQLPSIVWCAYTQHPLGVKKKLKKKKLKTKRNLPDSGGTVSICRLLNVGQNQQYMEEEKKYFSPLVSSWNQWKEVNDYKCQ